MSPPRFTFVDSCPVFSPPSPSRMVLNRFSSSQCLICHPEGPLMYSISNPIPLAAPIYIYQRMLTPPTGICIFGFRRLLVIAPTVALSWDHQPMKIRTQKASPPPIDPDNEGQQKDSGNRSRRWPRSLPIVGLQCCNQLKTTRRMFILQITAIHFIFKLKIMHKIGVSEVRHWCFLTWQP